MQVLPAAAISSAALVASDEERSFNITFAPAVANFLQIASPMPWPAPVTTATFRVNVIRQLIVV
jgi:hypothetical protein